MAYPFIQWPGADGLLEASIHAQWFGPVPLVNRYDARLYTPPPQEGKTCIVYYPQELGNRRTRRRALSAPVFCQPGHIPVPTGVPGQSKCVPYSPPSAMIGQPTGQVTVSTTVPPSYPTGRTFPVGPGFFS